MSNINIARAVENIRATTTVFTPIVEVVVNAIQAIEALGQAGGNVHIKVERSSQVEIDENERAVINVTVIDNGIGFDLINRDSFDTLYSAHKLKHGGKGFGRFTCLKYFEDLRIESIFFDTEYLYRRFSMGKAHQIVVNEEVGPVNSTASGTTVRLIGEKTGQLPRKLGTFARGLVELLLPYFTTENYTCPQITLSEADASDPIVLNEYLNSSDAVIKEVKLSDDSFSLQSKRGMEKFRIRVFKAYSPRNRISRVCLVAHRREVTESSLSAYIPEFAEEFCDEHIGDKSRQRNFILRTYVFGDYLDDNVALERGEFKFQKDGDLIFGLSQTEIERRAAALTKAAVASEVGSRQERKRARIEDYVETRAPWHKTVVKSVDFSNFPMAPTDAEIEQRLHEFKFRQEIAVKREVETLLENDDPAELTEKVAELVERVSESSKMELVHYVALRRQVLDLFGRALEITASGKYESETKVHEIIFPTRSDDQTVEYDDHNLWILDERLTFTSYLASDLPLSRKNSDRPDILAFDRRVAFRGDNEASNPVTIFEFKRPQRDDFVNPSAKEDPVQQIIRYVNSIRDGKFKTPKGRDIVVARNTPFYGYLVCDITPKVETWLRDEKNFTQMPDGQGWFDWRDNINLYIEVLSWDKLLKDATMRNRAFFYKLGIN